MFGPLGTPVVQQFRPDGKELLNGPEWDMVLEAPVRVGQKYRHKKFTDNILEVVYIDSATVVTKYADGTLDIYKLANLQSNYELVKE